MISKRFVAVVAVVFIASSAFAEVVRSGAMAVDLEQIKEVPRSGAALPKVGGNLDSLLVNSTFESGSMAPWVTSNWVISTISPLAGTYCAEDYGNYSIEQFFGPVDVSQITTVGFWLRQPDVAIFAVDFFYGASDYDEIIEAPPNADWNLWDYTYFLRASGSLTGIRIWGYTGGPNGPTYIDNALIFAGPTVAFPLASDFWTVTSSPYWWNAGDTVWGDRDVPLASVSRADIALKLSTNSLSDALGGYVDLAFQLDGSTVGTLHVTQAHGLGYVMGSFTFAPKTPPFELRYLELNTVVPGAGSMVLDAVGESWVTFSNDAASSLLFYDGFETGDSSAWDVVVP